MKRLLITALSALCMLLCAASASARSNLFGVVMNPDLEGQSAAVVNSQMALMARNGVQSLRTTIDWETTQPQAGPHYNWSQPDLIVGAAAAHGLQLLPIVEFTPQWASSHPSSAWNEYAPTSPSLYANFMTALVHRYGPHGDFWKIHHGRSAPVRTWQIWNEPEGSYYDWRSVPYTRTYTALLKAAYRAVHAADRGAKVVTGALVGLSCHRCKPWLEAADFYKAGWGHYYDIVAVNAYTNAPKAADAANYSIYLVHLVRQVMNRHHDHRPIWVTELTWPATLSYKVPAKYFFGIETTTKGQVARLTDYYTRIATQHPEGIQRAYWYAWTTPYKPYPVTGTDVTFQYSGLLKWTPTDPVFRPTAALAAYAKVAHRYANR